MLLNESPAFNSLRVIPNEALDFICTPVGKGLDKVLTVQVDPEQGGYTVTKICKNSQ